MRYMNRYELERAAMTFPPETYPNLARANLTVMRLANWADRNSDGWAYWPKPARAANKLMELLQTADPWEPVDITGAELRKASAPIKAFLTRQGINHDLIFADQVITFHVVTRSDTEAIEAIHKLMDKEEWDSDTLEAIAEEVILTGRAIRDPNEFLGEEE